MSTHPDPRILPPRRRLRAPAAVAGRTLFPESLERRVMLSAAASPTTFSQGFTLGQTSLNVYSARVLMGGNLSSLVALGQVLDAAPVSVDPADNLPVNAQHVDGKIATLIDDAVGNLPANWQANYSVVVNWGDGNATPAAVVANNADGYDVVASHSYGKGGTFNITVSVERRVALLQPSNLVTAPDAKVRTADLITGTHAVLPYLHIAAPEQSPGISVLPPPVPPPSSTDVPADQAATTSVPPTPSTAAEAAPPRQALAVSVALPAAPTAPATPPFKLVEVGAYRLSGDGHEVAAAPQDPGIFDGEFALGYSAPVPRGAPSEHPGDYTQPPAAAADVPAPPAKTDPRLLATKESPRAQRVDADPQPALPRAAVARNATQLPLVGPTSLAEAAEKRPAREVRLAMFDRNWKLALIAGAGTLVQWAHRRRRKADAATEV